MDDFKYGLMVLDPARLDVNGEVGVVHLCLYENSPTEWNKESLLEELKSDPEFGLTNIVDRLIIEEAPQEMVARCVAGWKESRGGYQEGETDLSAGEEPAAGS
jgi:hypothetical protein